jgi:hypothetical protein
MAYKMNESKVTEIYSIQQEEPKALHEWWWFRTFLEFGSLVTKCFPPLGHYIRRTPSGMQNIACRLLSERKYDEAFSICNEGLLRFRNRTVSWAHFDWWEFVRWAAYAADKLDDNDKKAQLFTVAEEGFPPFEGAGVASFFCFLSRWKGAEGDREGAIVYANRAREADEACAEACALLGWYGLVIDQPDSIEHFKNAIKLDIGYLNKITNDPVVREYPYIIKELRKLSVVENRKKP